MSVYESLPVAEVLSLHADHPAHINAVAVLSRIATGVLLLERSTLAAAMEFKENRELGLKHDLSLDRQGELLRENEETTYIEQYVGAGLSIGARLMDRRNGTGSMHATILEGLSNSVRMQSRRKAGRSNSVTPDQSKAMVMTNMRLVEEHVDPRLNDYLLSRRALGVSVMSGADHTASLGLESAMKGWSDPLRGLAMAVRVHGVAMRSARRLVRPLLQQDAPKYTPGQELKFWKTKLFGYGNNEPGVFYYLGFMRQSRKILSGHMQELWANDYERNSQVFTGALFLRTSTIDGVDRLKEIRKIRTPIFKAISEGDFGSAEQQLQELASGRPALFPEVGLGYFTKRKPGDPMSIEAPEMS